MYARLRRLEQRIERIDSAVTLIRRDVYRIEKKQQREGQPLSITPQPEPTVFGVGGI